MAEPKESIASREEKFIAAQLKDGLENLMTGLGTDKDKSSYNRWHRSGLNFDWDQLLAMFREDWVAQKVCKILPQDMTREWRRCSTPEAIKADKEMRVADLFREAYTWARTLGTTAILLDLKGTGLAETPLNVGRLKPGCIRSLQVVDRTRLMPTGEIEMNPMDPDYGYPKYYQLGGSTTRIHKSRLLRFEGTRLTRYENWRNQWYSDSVLIPLANTIANFHVAAQSAAALVQEANVDVVTVQGLQNLLTHPAGEAALMKRFRMMKSMKSNNNVLVLDDTEEYTTKTVALNGVKDLIWEYLRIIAAACGVPATRFLSASPDGMNATGESDLNNYIDLLRGMQKSEFDHRLCILDKVIAAHYGIEEYEYTWNCAFPESSLQKEERRNKLSETLKNLVEGCIITGDAAIKILQEEHIFGEIDLGTAPPPPPPPTQGTSSNAK